MITKAAAKAQQAASYASKFKRAEQAIDEALGKGGRTFQIGREWKNAFLDELIDGYRAVGWTVRVISDNRDGDYLEFS
jgi:hypothetical protein